MTTAKLTPVIKVDNSKCVNCYACISACPVKYCMDGSGDELKINHELCIGCGNCIKACTHNARLPIDDAEAFFTALEHKEKVIAIVAPSIASNFPGQYLNINGYLMALGVEAVFDVSFGAELTVLSYINYIKEKKPEITIAQPCPAIVTYLEIYHPELLPFLAPVDSPMLHLIKMIREFLPQYAAYRIAAISPCIAKRREFDETLLGDYNVTYIALRNHLAEHNIDLAQFPPLEYVGPVAERGVTFSMPGGLLTTADRESPGLWQHTRKIEGVETVYPYLKDLANTWGRGNRESLAFSLVDCLSCDLGCNGGPGTGSIHQPRNLLEVPIQKRRGEMEARYTGEGKLAQTLAQYWKPGLYTRTYGNRFAPFLLKEPDEEQLKTVYESIGKYTPSDIYDCTSCGYGSCKAMGVAIFNHLNQPRNCHHYDLLLVKRGDELQKLSMELQAQRDEMTVMKDNLQAGVFLMDKEYIIQPLYSRALESLLGDTNLQGKSFIDMLASSIRVKEIDTLKDYFTKLFDGQAIDNLNPLREFNYVSMNVVSVKDTGVRHLRTVFSLIDQGREGLFIMGTIEDATTEKKLRQELSEVESRRQEDMRSLFEVIQIGPQALRDFIEDTDFEFNRTNDLLKDERLSPQQVITEMAQAVYAIKSDAIILGLDSFSQQLHKLELAISDMGKQEELSFDDVLSLSFDLDLLMKERDKFSDALERFDSFNLTVQPQHQEDMFVASLRKAGERAAEAHDKEFRLVAKVDPNALAHGPRREMKEMLTQLMRNAVYYGIETPAERLACGKDKAGLIGLSITLLNDTIHIKLGDDGHGLDFDSIRATAFTRGLLQSGQQYSEPQLVKLIFEPTFSTASETDLYAGRGIGLNQVRDRVIELHGSIKVRTALGKGTVFNLFIPIEASR